MVPKVQRRALTLHTNIGSPLVLTTLGVSKSSLKAPKAQLSPPSKLVPSTNVAHTLELLATLTLNARLPTAVNFTFTSSCQTNLWVW